MNPERGRRPAQGLLLWGASVVSLLFLMVTFAAGPAGAAAAKSTKGSSSTRSITAYRTCLAKHGVKLPATGGFGGTRGSFPHSGSFPGGSFPGGSFPHNGSFPGGSFPHNGSFPSGARFGGNSKQAKAFAACASKAPKGFGGRFPAGGSAPPTAAQTAALKNYDECMATHGVQIAANATYQVIRSLIASDPAAATANTACQSDLQGAFGPPPKTSTSTTTG